MVPKQCNSPVSIGWRHIQQQCLADAASRAATGKWLGDTAWSRLIVCKTWSILHPALPQITYAGLDGCRRCLHIRLDGHTIPWADTWYGELGVFWGRPAHWRYLRQTFLIFMAMLLWLKSASIIIFSKNVVMYSTWPNFFFWKRIF